MMNRYSRLTMSTLLLAGTTAFSCFAATPAGTAAASSGTAPAAAGFLPAQAAANGTVNSAGAPGGQPPMIMNSDGTMMPAPAPEQTKDISTFTAARIISNDTVAVANGQFSSSRADENVFLINDKAIATVNHVTLAKTGNTTSGDGSNFNGQNAVFLAAGGSQASLANSTILSKAEGANAVFSTGEKTVVSVSNLKIDTGANSSRGLDATYGGTIIGKNVTISTQGAHSAALATDRGEGTVTVTEGTLSTAGDGSPVIYSTGAITVKDTTGHATGSEIAVIEGKNSISVEKSKLTGDKKNGVMLYQSFSGDAESGTASFTAKDSSLTSNADGAMFYITNTDAVVTIDNTELTYPSGILIKAGADHWGSTGSNGGHLQFNAAQQKLSGNVVADAISSVAMNLSESSVYTGTINSDQQAQKASLTLSASSVWNVTGDSWLTGLTDSDASYRNIHSNGHNIYVTAAPGSTAQTVALPGGGQLIFRTASQSN